MTTRTRRRLAAVLTLLCALALAVAGATCPSSGAGFVLWLMAASLLPVVFALLTCRGCNGAYRLCREGYCLACHVYGHGPGPQSGCLAELLGVAPIARPVPPLGPYGASEPCDECSGSLWPVNEHDAWCSRFDGRGPQ